MMATTFCASALVGFGAFGAPLWPCAKATAGIANTAAAAVMSLSFIRPPCERKLSYGREWILFAALCGIHKTAAAVFHEWTAAVYAKSTAKRLRSASAQ